MRRDGLSAIVHVCSQFFLASNWNGARPVFFNILNDLLQLGGMCTWVPNRLSSSWRKRLERGSWLLLAPTGPLSDVERGLILSRGQTVYAIYAI